MKETAFSAMLKWKTKKYINSAMKKIFVCEKKLFVKFIWEFSKN